MRSSPSSLTFVSRLAIRFGVALCVTGRVHAQVDLSPISNTYDLDGVKMTNVLFKDGTKELTYQPPTEWRISGSGPRLTLVPPAFINTDAQIEVKPAQVNLPFDDANLPKYTARAQAFIPKDATKVEVLGTEKNPLRISGKDTLAVQMRYLAFGVTYQTYVLFLNRAQDQWTFRFTAPVDTYPKAFEPFRASLYSMTGL